MKKHELKTLPQYFQAVWNGTKTFELRKDDRDYQRGDILVLREWDGEKYTGSALCVKVAYILQDAEKYGLKDGYVIMGIRRIESNADFKPVTSADRIRAKCETDEGLYAFILGVHSLTTDRYGDPDYRLVVEGEEFRDDESLLSWLKSPVEAAE